VAFARVKAWRLIRLWCLGLRLEEARPATLLPLDTTILLAAVSATAALAGTWLGSSLSARNEDRRWLRQERLNAYTALLAAADDWRDSASELRITVIGSAERRDKTTEFYKRLAALDLAADRAKIIASDATGLVVDAMMAHFVGQIMTLAVQEPMAAQAKWDPAQDGYIDQILSFRQAARADVTANPAPQFTRLHEVAGEVWRYLSR
jgi:hypothetical protein